MIDPLLGGLWVMTTASGATYWIDATDPDRAATIQRRTPSAAPETHVAPAQLRRDGEPIRLIALRHRAADHTTGPGLRVGAEALLVLAPLTSTADVTLRWTTPVVTVERAEHGPQWVLDRPVQDRAKRCSAPKAPDPDVALIDERIATDSGTRFGVDEVIRTLGYDRAELEADAGAEEPSTSGPFVIDVVRATSGRLALNITAPADVIFEVEHLHEVEPLARATLGGVLDVPGDDLDLVVHVDSLVVPGHGDHVPGRAILITHDDEAQLVDIERRAARLGPEGRELVHGLLRILRRPLP